MRILVSNQRLLSIFLAIEENENIARLARKLHIPRNQVDYFIEQLAKLNLVSVKNDILYFTEEGRRIFKEIKSGKFK